MAMDAASAMGSIALWGFSPAIDFTVEDSNPGAFEFWNKDGCDAASVLFAGVPDLCHILQNLPEALHHPNRPVDFYVLENSVEVYARQLLLLWLLCEPADSVGLQEKVWMFLEIVGNTLIRPSTARYIAETATKLIDLVTGGDDCAALPLVSLAELRHRERDQIAAVFQFWRSSDPKIDVAHMWDLRLRQQLAQRYDARSGVFDWDYYMRLKDRLEVEFVQPEEYKHWRETGVAFRRPGTEQTCPNKTLVTVRALGRPGERQLRRGYWGDIVSGPYAPFGLRSGDPSLARKQNGRLVATAATVSAANLEALFSSMSSSLSTASHMRVRFLPADGGAALSRRAAFRGRFAAAVFSSGMSHLLTPPVTACLRDGATVAVETARYVVCVTAEQQGRLLERYGELADTADCRPLRESDGGEGGGEVGEMSGEQEPAERAEEMERKEDQSSMGESEADRSGKTAGMSDGDQTEERLKPKEIAPVSQLNAGLESSKAETTVTEEGDECQPADQADEGKPITVGNEHASIKPPVDVDAGDLPRTVDSKDGDKVTELADNVQHCQPTGTVENGAGEPKISGAAAGTCVGDATPDTAEQLERCPLPVKDANADGEDKVTFKNVLGQKEGISQSTVAASDSSSSGVDNVDPSRAPSKDSCSVGVNNVNPSSASDPSSDGTDSREPPSASDSRSTGVDSVKSTASAARRFWASDKLTALPEWVCFVKRRADGVVSDLLSW
ncbi:dynein axonemal assembly factor 3-like [Amphibalanus amphitrite]|uniref:dynein axonemal assembly factor 3-like n=1 Tax=Amphibalanus amphitrite TaxID=1232801 RepID=UPI001C8FB2A7|nr:dynein axonemal assembly factor 3-like [Amphibalanus amphitrite]